MTSHQLTVWVVQYAIAAVIFLLLDLTWLGRIGRPLYQARMGHLMADPPNVPAAIAFYAIFVAGLVYFVIHPAAADGSWLRALIVGAFFGLVTYATWDLTNLAVLADFPSSIVPIDIAWGIVLSALVSVFTTLIVRALPAWAPAST